MTTSAETGTVRLIRNWSRLYTRGLPEHARERRRLELESDMWDHLHDPSEPNARQALFGRFFRGIPADVWWRYRTLLDFRGARQRSYNMTSLSRTNWWLPVSMILGLTVGLLALLGLTLGSADDGGRGLALNWLVSSALMLSGLAVLRRRPVAGSWLVIGGGALVALSGFGIPVALIVVGGGLWSGNLVITESGAAKLDLAPREASVTQHWYRWLVAAVGLGAIGLLVLLIWPAVTPDGCTELNPCWQDSAAWAVWILSWMAGAATAAVGVILAGVRFTRHHTRPA